ncbi:MAG: T9SS type A sorting domain-containing protein [Candidatus Marinimicrobia bacterium]|nr:T9SS type A sorting domain-containing protein [Candidatus Neomarinimicrobiota bacterium]MDP6611628.1 T9SS type A sorting domain-containing protein [Candidatus Neomarinimicrobiota bacterium]
MINKFNQYLLFLFFGLLSGQATRATIQSGPIDYLDQLPEIPLCAVPTLTDAFIKDHLEKMKTEYPDIYRRMKAPPVRHKTSQVGDIETFWVFVDDASSGGTKSAEIVAKLMAKGNSTAIWADTAQLKNATNISDALAADYIKLLENTTPAGSRDSSKGIYDLELQYFGDVPNYDGDGIVDFLFADIYTGAGGYFSPQDQSNQTGSNQRDILYLDTYASISYTEGTLSHELQHLIHYNYDSYEEIQFNEGLSEMATMICGGDYISHAHYLSQADQMGWGWDSDASYYAMASLFTLYYVEQLGDGAIKDFIKINAGNNPLQGWRAFDQLLSNYGTGKTHREWLVDWYTANYIDNKLINPKYGYDQWLPMRAKLTAKHLSGKIESTENKVLGYGPNYIVYASSVDSMEITFTSQSGGIPHIRSVEFNDSTAVTNTITEGVKHLVYHDSLKVRSAIFVVVSQENYSMKYDYNSEGTDASGWTGFEEIVYDDGSADVFTTSDGSQFGYLGWGNDHIGWGWGMMFDPKMAINQLVEFKVVLGFEQEFSGSTTPANADKDFNVHVWEIVDDEGNVKDLIDPILWKTSRTSLSGNWSVIDMTPYKDKLSNLGKVVIGIVEDDTIGTYFAMDKNVNGENYTYAFNYNDGGVLDSLSLFSVGGESMAGWNYFMRASFFIADATVPAMKAGFMQNPVFTDELNLFIIGNSVMDADKMLITAKNAGYETVLDAQIVAGNDSILVTDNYRLHASGALDITTKGTFRYGRADIDTTFTYNVNYTLAKVGGDIVSRDKNYIMTIPENSLAEDGYIIVGIDDNSPAAQNILLPEKSAPIYIVSPVGKSLEKGARISIEVGDLNPAEVSIGYWDGEAWLELNTMISHDGKRVAGVGTHLGHYTLIPKGSGNPLALDEEKVIPVEYALHQNYPNPFNPETFIHFDLPKSGHVSLMIYDILGRELVSLINQNKPVGRHKVLWNGNNSNGQPAVSGIYFYRISSNGFSQTKKMILTR